MSYVAPRPKSADLRKGNHMVRFSWNTGPACKPGVTLHIFPDTEESSIACQSVKKTRQQGRREWQKLLNSGFERVRIPTV